jgi:hypothetical protein
MNAISTHSHRRSAAVLLLTALTAASIVATAADQIDRHPTTAAANTAAASPSKAVESSSAVTGAGGRSAPGTHAASAHSVSETSHGKPPESHRAKRRADRGVHKGYVAPKPGNHEDEEDEVQNGEAKNAYSSKQLLYFGGAVQTAPRIYLVFWGANWFSGGDPYGVANRLDLFYSGISRSGYANVLTQFGSNYGSFSNPAGQYIGYLQDRTAVPAQPTKTDVQNAARRAAKAANDYSYNTQYIIAMPWGSVDQFSTANKFCAWHDWTYATSTSSYWITYTSMPYIPYMDYIGRGCGKGSVNGTNGLLDGVTILASHEYAESVNNPSLNAWRDFDGYENADKCSWIDVANRPFANGYWFPVQPYWSNSWRATYGYGCYYS